MDLTKEVVPKSLLQKIIIGLMLIIAGAGIWSGLTAFQGIHSILNDNISLKSTEGVESYFSQNSVGFSSFTFTKTANMDTTYTYVTLTDLTFSPSKKESFEILSSASRNDKILGLSSHPSFLVSQEQRSFWKTQVYLELGFIVGGFFLIVFAVIWIISFNIEEYRKLFTENMYRWVMALFFIFFTGFMIDTLLYARKIIFLNEEFYLGLSPTGGISPSMLFVLFLLLFVLIFLRKGIPLQNEQDLTV